MRSCKRCAKVRRTDPDPIRSTLCSSLKSSAPHGNHRNKDSPPMSNHTSLEGSYRSGYDFFVHRSVSWYPKVKQSQAIKDYLRHCKPSSSDNQDICGSTLLKIQKQPRQLLSGFISNISTCKSMSHAHAWGFADVRAPIVVSNSE